MTTYSKNLYKWVRGMTLIELAKGAPSFMEGAPFYLAGPRAPALPAQGFCVLRVKRKAVLLERYCFSNLEKGVVW